MIKGYAQKRSKERHETLDADYKDVESLKNLDNINTMRCRKHIKNCALQNVQNVI